MKIGDLLVAGICAVGVYFLAQSAIAPDHSDKDRALNECIKEITSKCKGAISYAIALEDENARLNRKLKECRASKKP